MRVFPLFLLIHCYTICYSRSLLFPWWVQDQKHQVIFNKLTHGSIIRHKSDKVTLYLRYNFERFHYSKNVACRMSLRLYFSKVENWNIIGTILYSIIHGLHVWFYIVWCVKKYASLNQQNWRRSVQPVTSLIFGPCP